MLQELQQIIGHPLWNWGFFTIAIILAIILFSKGKKVRKPRYYIKSHNLVTDFSSKITKLKMLYDNEQIERLTVSKIAFWNGGETINKVDIADTEPLRIETIGSCDIVDANVIKVVNPVNNFCVEIINKKEVRILFDFLDRGQGGAIQIMHTGKESSDIKVDGFVKGAGSPLPSFTRNRIFWMLDKVLMTSKQPQTTKPQPVKARRMMAFVSFGIALLTLIGLITQGGLPEKIFLAIFFMFYVYYGYILLKRRVPKGLEIVEEEESY